MQFFRKAKIEKLYGIFDLFKERSFPSLRFKLIQIDGDLVIQDVNMQDMFELLGGERWVALRDQIRGMPDGKVRSGIEIAWKKLE